MNLIISDYHRREDYVELLIKKYNPDRILCLGDSESEDYFLMSNGILSVKGNCDYNDLPLKIVIEINGKRVLMIHGHQHGVKFGLDRLYYLALQEHCDYVFYGHTHVPHKEIIDGITFFNPGALLYGEYALMDDDFNIELKML